MLTQPAPLALTNSEAKDANCPLVAIWSIGLKFHMLHVSGWDFKLYFLKDSAVV